jgi:hypothetical protein
MRAGRRAGEGSVEQLRAVRHSGCCRGATALKSRSSTIGIDIHRANRPAAGPVGAVHQEEARAS